MITLRAATLADWARLYTWRNDPACLAGFFSGKPVTPGEHWAWLKRTLADPKTSLWMAEDGTQAIGTGRIDADRYVSLTVAPEHRGRGQAAQIIAALLEREPDARAIVKPDNLASLRAFASCGFVPVVCEEDRVVLHRPQVARVAA